MTDNPVDSPKHREPLESRSSDRAVYVISIAAELAGVHPQTLRLYERKGLLHPSRTSGNTRRYSDQDVNRLQQIQQLTQREGVNLAGVRIIMQMQAQMERLEAQLTRARRRLSEVERRLDSETERRPTWGALVRLSDVRDIFGRS